MCGDSQEREEINYPSDGRNVATPLAQEDGRPLLQSSFPLSLFFVLSCSVEQVERITQVLFEYGLAQRASTASTPVSPLQ